jgi:transposase
MARYVEHNRDAALFVAGSLEDLLQPDSVARMLWAGVEQLDFAAYDALRHNDAAGRSALNPRCLVAVWMLAILRGVTSSVRLAALCGQDIEFRWLLGDTPVQKSTLCSFRKNHKNALASLSAQVLAALGANGLLPGKNMGVDGTIVRAASSRHAVKNRKGLEKRKKHLEALIEEKLSQEDCDSESEEMKALERRRQRTAQALEDMTARGLTGDSDRWNTTEPDAALVRQKDGSFAPGYNGQAAPDFDSGALIDAQIVDAGGDGGQLQPQFERAQAVLAQVKGDEAKTAPAAVAADGAYHDVRQLEALERRGVQCYVPENRDANRTPPGVAPEYRAEAFAYDEETDTMCCPQGQTLKRRKLNNSQTSAVYQVPGQTCQGCPAKPQCCPNTKEGRCVNRSLHIQTLETVANRVNSEEGRRMKTARSVTCEGTFARLKESLHWHRCRMWGRTGAEMELLWRQFIHNLMLLAGIWKPMVMKPSANG